MADQSNNPQSGKRDSESFVPWSSSFPATSENNGYQPVDSEIVKAHEYRQELENQRQQQLNDVPDKKPTIAVGITELQQEHFSRANYPQYPPLTKPSGWAIFWREWWLETITCFVVMGALGAIVSLVWAHNKQPLPNWKHGITINSLISIFLVIMKSGMGLVLAQGLAHLKWTWFDNARPLQDLETYDKAAHGPAGAAMLLLTVRNRHLITSIGAVVTIAALAIDPTVQAMVKYYDCSWAVSGINATMPHAQVYDELGIHSGAGQTTIPLGMQSAINSGLWTPGVLTSSFGCFSGNCTFPSGYTSIGYCSKCTDISDRVKFENLVGRDYSGGLDPITGLNYTEYNYTKSSLPNGMFTINADGYPESTFFTMQPSNDDPSIIDLLVGQNPSYITEQPASGCKSEAVKKDWGCQGYGAASCQLQPCLQTFTGHVAGGKLIETSVAASSEWGSREGASPYSAIVDMGCITPLQREGLKELGYNFNNSTRYIPYNVTFDETTGDFIPDGSKSQATLSLIPRHCIYEINGQVMNSLNQYWPTFFNGTLTPASTSFTGPPIVELFFNEGAITFSSVAAIFANVTAAMTTHMRQNGVAAFSPPVQGTIMHNVTCVRVRWQFLLFPAALIALLLLFFVGMALDTRNRKGVQGVDHQFKSSPLALMVHGLDSEVQEKLNPPIELMGTAGAEKSVSGPARNDAKKVVVRLSPTEHGLRFVRD